jgi:hypothetical protein
MFIGVQGKGNAQGDHMVIKPVAEGEVAYDRKGEGFHMLQNHSPDVLRGVTVLEPSKEESAKLLKDSRMFQLGETAVQPIEGFGAILNEEHCAREVRKEGRAQKMHETGEVASRHGSRSHPVAKYPVFSKSPGKISLSAQRIQYIVQAGRFVPKVQEIGTVKGDPSHLALERKVQERDVAVAEKDLSALSQVSEGEPLQESSAPVASTSAKDGGGRRIGDGPDEVLSPFRLCTGQIFPPMEDVFTRRDPVTL